MTDTGPPLTSPPSDMDRWQAFIGELARPFAIISTSLAASVSMVVIAVRVPTPDFSTGAIYIAAVGAFVGGIYAGKSWEIIKTGKHAADVEIAKAATPAP